MIYDSIATACCVHELALVLKGARIAEVHQPRRLEICLELETPARRVFIIAGAEPAYARLTEAERLPPRAEVKYPFGLFARKHLKGAVIESIEQVGFDRIVRLRVDPRNPRLIDPARTLVVEIMGKHSNIALLNNVDMVLEAAKHITADVSRARTMLPHDDYVLPPTSGGRDPRTLSLDGWRELLASLEGDRPMAQILASVLEGANRLVIAEALHLAGLSQDATDAAPRTLDDLAHRLTALYGRVARSEFAPVSWPSPKGGADHYAFALEHGGVAYERVSRLGVALDAEAALARKRAEAASATQALRNVLAHARKVLEKRRRETAQSQRDPAQIERLREIGDAILAGMSRIGSHDTVVELPNVHSAEGEVLRIELDPSRGPQANAERYFRRYKSARARAALIPRLLEETERDLVELGELEAELGTADPAEVTELAERLRQHRLTRNLTQAAQRGREDAEGGFLSRVSSDGFEMLIGRSAAESDEILRHVAAPDDLWLHARDQHGGHVVVRANRHPERVPMSTILEAASIAAYYSKSKHSSLVPVDYTLKKHVRRARKGAPGLQIYEKSKTVIVEPYRRTP